MFRGRYFKWEKLEGNAWTYGPSVLEDRPIICRVAPASLRRPPRPRFYRAEIGRPPGIFVGVGRDRDTITAPRQDEHFFMRSNYSYENLVVLHRERMDDFRSSQRNGNRG